MVRNLIYLLHRPTKVPCWKLWTNRKAINENHWERQSLCQTLRSTSAYKCLCISQCVYINFCNSIKSNLPFTKHMCAVYSIHMCTLEIWKHSTFAAYEEQTVTSRNTQCTRRFMERTKQANKQKKLNGCNQKVIISTLTQTL